MNPRVTVGFAPSNNVPEAGSVAVNERVTAPGVYDVETFSEPSHSFTGASTFEKVTLVVPVGAVPVRCRPYVPE